MKPGFRCDDPTPIADLDAPVTLFEHVGQRTVSGGGQPKAEQVPTFFGIGPVHEPSPVVKLRVIVDELHIAGGQSHGQMQLWIIGEGIKHVQSLDMSGR